MSISSISLLLSFVSLCVSLYVMRRDQGLSASANAYMDPHELLGYTLGIYLVNTGKNPLTIRKLVIEQQNGDKFEHPVRDKTGNPLKLAQSEFHELFLTQNNSALTEWVKLQIKSAKALDSYGKTWNVKDFAEIINHHHHAEKPGPAPRPAF